MNFIGSFALVKQCRFVLSGRFDRISSMTSGSTPDMRTEGGGERMDGRMLDRGQVEMEGVGRSPPPRDVCGSQAKEMLQPRREGSST